VLQASLKSCVLFPVVFCSFSFALLYFHFCQPSVAVGSIFQHLNIRPPRINNKWTWFEDGVVGDWGLGTEERTSFCRGPGEVNEGQGMEAAQMLQPVNSG